ncbi:MAG TPA: LysM domain-containing protein [Dehalococcoidia bacterium]
MRLSRARCLVACASIALLGAAFGACGGGGTASGRAPDLSKIPTATLPPALPEPSIIGGGALQPGGGSTYSVKSGDTLAGIAERFGVSLEDLRAANPNLDPSRLSVGDAVRLPALNGDQPLPTQPAAATSTTEAAPPTAEATATTAAPPPTEPPAATATASSLGQTYTVQSGDIPVTIAEKFGITVEALIAANPGINPTNLQIGQVLVIPPAAPTATP